MLDGGHFRARLAAFRKITTARGHAAAPESVALQHTFLVGFHAALTVAAGLAAVGIFAALVRGDEGRSNHATLQINSSPGPTA
jgi:hypothetical protein